MLPFIGIVAIMALLIFSAPKKHGKSQKSIYRYSFTSIDDTVISLESFKGKKILFVNVASQCGFTPQYEDLEKLYRQYNDKLVIIGFPSNDFFDQEPGTDEEIAAFCKLNYQVTFPMSRKISVKGKEMHPVYQWLTDEKLNGWNSTGPKWNFYKYLVDEQGELMETFSSTTTPFSRSIISLIEK